MRASGAAGGCFADEKYATKTTERRALLTSMLALRLLLLISLFSLTYADESKTTADGDLRQCVAMREAHREKLRGAKDQKKAASMLRLMNKMMTKLEGWKAIPFSKRQLWKEKQCDLLL